MGAETGASWSLTPNWALTGSLSYAWGENRSDKQPLPQMPPLEGRLALDYTGQQWRTGLLWRVVAPQHRVAQNKGNVTGGSRPERGVWRAFVERGLHLTTILSPAWVLRICSINTTASTSTAGASQFGYAANQQIPEPGRVWWLAMTYHFDPERHC